MKYFFHADIKDILGQKLTRTCVTHIFGPDYHLHVEHIHIDEVLPCTHQRYSWPNKQKLISHIWSRLSFIPYTCMSIMIRNKYIKAGISGLYYKI